METNKEYLARLLPLLKKEIYHGRDLERYTGI